MGIDPDDTVSPGVMQKMIHVAGQSKSFEAAAKDFEVLAELRVSSQRIVRVAQRIGNERVAEREQEIQDWQQLTLPEQQKSPPGLQDQTPPVACVESDGGRMQIRDRQASQPPPTKGRKGRYWREMKVGCLQSMTSETFAEDPCPQLPDCFANLAYMGKVSREIKRSVREEDSPAEAAVSAATPEQTAAKEEAAALQETRAADRTGRPKVLVRSVVATRRSVDEFGPQLAAAAWRRGFMGALRKAFVADGSETNWGVWRKYFSHFTPILDFVHALCYVYAAALAGRPLDEATAVFPQWAQWLWSGRVSELIEALEQRQQQLGVPQKGESETTPRSVVAEALCYVRNQQSRMKYADYRRQGLPITSSHIESTIKQVNRRVKGSEKFWHQSAEPILQLVADQLSQTQPLDAFWANRPRNATGQRHYQTTR